MIFSIEDWRPLMQVAGRTTVFIASFDLKKKKMKFSFNLLNFTIFGHQIPRPRSGYTLNKNAGYTYHISITLVHKLNTKQYLDDFLLGREQVDIKAGLGDEHDLVVGGPEESQDGGRLRPRLLAVLHRVKLTAAQTEYFILEKVQDVSIS